MQERSSEQPSAGYVMKAIPLWRRALLVPFILGVVFLSGYRWIEHLQEKSVLLLYGVFPAAFLAAGVYSAWYVWKQDQYRVYETVLIMPGAKQKSEAKRRTVWYTLLAIALVGGIWWEQFMQSTFNKYWWYMLPVIVLWGLLVYGANRLAPEHQLSRAALEAIALEKYAKSIAHSKTDGSKWEVAIDKLGKMWWVRYGCAALMLIWAYNIADQEVLNRNDWMLIGLLCLLALLCMKELALWILGIGIVVAIGFTLFGAIAALPLSVAVIIGALIIASSLRR